ncbi:MAG: DNA translocase FtsK 4TM domain-containing protein [Bacteroidales bacterium]|nr:DNA translocase FtsK 4TM domain-containing protein [Bacteroidales bacterium]
MANQVIRNQQVGSKKKKGKGKAGSPKKAPKENGKAKSGWSWEWIHNRNVQLLAGLYLIFFAIFLFCAFCSFFQTHTEDITTADRSFLTTLHNGKVTSVIGNRLGILGLYFSFLFIRFGFGIASFGFLFLFVLWGIYLIWHKSVLPLFKTFMGTCFSMIWLSLLFGWVFGNNSRTDWLGGDIGNTLSRFLIDTSIGSIGFLLLLLFMAIVILVIFFGLTFHLPAPKGKKPEKETEDTEDEEEKETPEETGNPLPKQPITVKPVEQPLPDEEEDEEDFSEETEEILPTTEVTANEKGTTLLPADPIDGDDLLLPEDDTETFDLENPDLGLETDALIGTETAQTHASIESYMAEGLSYEEAREKYIASLPPLDPRDELIHFEFPAPELLEDYKNEVSSLEERELEIQKNKTKIRTILSNFGVEIQSITAIEGPTVTMYEIVPAAGVRIHRIKNLEDDIALSVAAIGIRIIAPIPGKGTVGIEVPNSKPKIVPMRDMITSEKFIHAKKMALPIAIGKTIANEVFVFDLAKTPHVLMAGATGQGKSVGLNAILTSLLYYKHPTELKLVLVDPKKVELTLYSKIERHYLAKLPDAADAIITDTKQVVRTLNSLCIEMDNRYELLKKAQCRNLIEYNEKFKSRHLNPENGHHFLPYIVLIFDEFADCIMTAGREVESPVARLAQLARAVGIHLIVATQRPSVNIITGVIKANFPARIAFRVSSSVDSRTILDTSGAERLIGKGDMLISNGGEITRIQCALVDTPEIERICDHIGEQHGFTHAYMLPEVPEDTEDNTQTADDGEIDPCFADAARMVVQTGHGSTSLLQRKLKLGYNRAGRVMDQLEREGIVGAFEGSKARDVLIKDQTMLENKLKEMGLA